MFGRSWANLPSRRLTTAKVLPLNASFGDKGEALASLAAPFSLTLYAVSLWMDNQEGGKRNARPTRYNHSAALFRHWTSVQFNHFQPCVCHGQNFFYIANLFSAFGAVRRSSDDLDTGWSAYVVIMKRNDLDRGDQDRGSSGLWVIWTGNDLNVSWSGQGNRIGEEVHCGLELRIMQTVDLDMKYFVEPN